MAARCCRIRRAGSHASEGTSSSRSSPANAARPKAWSWCQWVTTTDRTGTPAVAAADARRSPPEAPGVVRPEVRDRLAGLAADAFRRGDFESRRVAQAERLQLPVLPTTTIGSFPQTPEIRVARAAFGRGELTAEQYEDEMKAEIRRVDICEVSRIVVGRGSAYDLYLTREIKAATLVRAPTSPAA